MPTYSSLIGGGWGAVLLKTPHPHSLTERKSLVGFTLDRSESMESLATVAIQSVNELIEQQKAIAVDSRFTLSLFNHSVTLIHDAIALCDVPPLLPTQYQPEGGTALNDSIAHLIHSLGSHSGRGAVLAVILTDGEENHSLQYSRDDVRQMVTYRRLNHGWQFLFLGPEGALDYAVSIGIPKVNTANFSTTPEGLRLMLERLSKGVTAYRLGDRQFALKLRNS